MFTALARCGRWLRRKRRLGGPVVQVRFGVAPAVAEAVYGYLVGGGEFR